MVRVAGLPDFSKFVRRVDRLKVYNTIHFVIGEITTEVNGCIISQRSEMLEDLVCCQREIYLDQFVGEEDGIQDCVELLYGGDIDLNNTNVKTIMKFSVIYQVNDMFELCIDWINANISKMNLFNMIELGLLVESVGHGNHVLLDICKNFIMEYVKDNISNLSESWSFTNNHNFIKFLVQDEILYFTLPILTSWINNDSGIRLVLEQAEVKGLTQGLVKYGSRTTELITKMSDKMELMETSRKIVKLQISISMEERACSSLSPIKGDNISLCSSEDPYIDLSLIDLTPDYVNMLPPDKDLTTLLSEKYQSFSVEKLLGLEEEYGLKHFEFVDIALHWIVNNIPSQEDIMKLWSNVRQVELDYSYLWYARNTMWTIEYSQMLYEPLINSNVINICPELEEIEEYQHIGGGWWIQGEHTLHSLINNEPVVLKIECEKCCTISTVNLRLEDKSPSYVLDEDSHCLVQHWYIKWKRDGKVCYYSLITNKYSDVIEKLKGCIDTVVDDEIYLCWLYKCRDEKQSHHTGHHTSQTKKWWKRKKKGGQK